MTNDLSHMLHPSQSFFITDQLKNIAGIPYLNKTKKLLL